jgi:hypothetical protein
MGPLRPLSELDFKGEASIQLVKKHINHGTSAGKSWAYNAAVAYYKEKSFKFVLNDAVVGVKSNADSSTSDKSTCLMIEIAEEVSGKAAAKGGETSFKDEGVVRAQYKNHVWYTTSDEVEALLKTGSAVSGIVASRGRYCVAVGKYPNEKYLEISPESFFFHICGADYFVWELNSFEEGIGQSIDKALARQSTHYFLLLPLLNYGLVVQNNDAAVIVQTKAFYLITSEWRELSKPDCADAIPTLNVGTVGSMEYTI